jgi:hypothetical protein
VRASFLFRNYEAICDSRQELADFNPVELIHIHFRKRDYINLAFADQPWNDLSITTLHFGLVNSMTTQRGSASNDGLLRTTPQALKIIPRRFHLRHHHVKNFLAVYDWPPPADTHPVA